jgi:hypothetical protein
MVSSLYVLDILDCCLRILIAVIATSYQVDVTAHPAYLLMFLARPQAVGPAKPGPNRPGWARPKPWPLPAYGSASISGGLSQAGKAVAF